MKYLGVIIALMVFVSGLSVDTIRACPLSDTDIVMYENADDVILKVTFLNPSKL